MSWLKHNWLGLAFTGLITALSIYLAQWQVFSQLGLSALTLAIILGMIVGNTLYPTISTPLHAGVNFSKAKLLRLGIILYGFRLTFQQIADVGLSSIFIDALIVCTTFSLAVYIGLRYFKLHPHTVLLIGAGASICGAAAVMATEPLLNKTKSSRVSVAVATVVIFGTIGLFFYPWLYHYLSHLGYEINPRTFGIYIGSTVHEVAQVVVAGEAVSPVAADNAVITKMVRVMMLAPFLLYLSYSFNQRKNKVATQKKPIAIPWFAVFFILVTCFNSLHLLPQQWVDFLITFDTVLLAMAMAALGLTTHVGAIKQAGTRPLLLAAFLFFWLVLGGAGINAIVHLFI